MTGPFIVEKSFAGFRFEIWPNAPRLRNRLRLVCDKTEVEVDVDQRSLEVLEQLLLRQPNVVVSEDDIAKAVWLGDHRRDSLDTHIYTLRKYLNDDARQPKFIKTIHGEGYSFIFQMEGNAQARTRRA